MMYKWKWEKCGQSKFSSNWFQQMHTKQPQFVSNFSFISCTTKAQHDIQFKNTEREIEKHDYNKLCLGSVVGDIFLLICMSWALI